MDSPSPNTWKVRAVAAHLGAALELELVDLTKPRTPEYLAINPSGRTPTLVDGDFTLSESNAIMQYRRPLAEYALAQRRARPRRHHAGSAGSSRISAPKAANR
jgi:glutathione S-transferase